MLPRALSLHIFLHRICSEDLLLGAVATVLQRGYHGTNTACTLLLAHHHGLSTVSGVFIIHSQTLPRDLWRLGQGEERGWLNEKLRANDQKSQCRDFLINQAAFTSRSGHGKIHPDPRFSSDCWLAARTQESW